MNRYFISLNINLFNLIKYLNKLINYCKKKFKINFNYLTIDI